MNAEIRKLREQQAKIVTDARERLNEIKDDTPEARVAELESQFDAAMQHHDLIQEKIDRMQELDYRDSRRPMVNGEAPGVDENEQPCYRNLNNGESFNNSDNRWFDTKSESEVRVVQRGETFSRQASSVPMGAILRSMIIGPRNSVERRALSEGTDSAGGYTVPAPLAGNFIDLMRARSHVFGAGALTVELPSQTLQIAKIATDPTPTWRAENATVTESDPSLTRVLFTARSLAVITKISRELVQDSANIDAILERVFAESFANEIDRVALLGTGTAPEPQGISGATGVSAVSMGANGAALADYSKPLEALQALEDANSDNPTSWIMAPRSKFALAGLTATDNQPLTAPALVSAVPTRSSSKIPIDQTQGTASDASTVFVGDFRQLLVGVRSELRIEILRERYADTHQLGFVAHARIDIQLAQPGSFAEINGVIP